LRYETQQEHLSLAKTLDEVGWVEVRNPTGASECGKNTEMGCRNLFSCSE